jgi:hypothetical protein
MCVSLLRKAERKHGIKRRAQVAGRFPEVLLRRAAGALFIKFSGWSTAFVGQIAC